MKIAVMSDIHGNFSAFCACMAEAERQGIHTYAFLGDYLGEFPYPEKTLKKLYEMKEQYDCRFVRGNKEDYWLNRKKEENCEWKDGNSSVGAMKYCYSALTDRDLQFFEGLPIWDRIEIEGCAPIGMCHASPFSNRAGIRSMEDAEKALAGQNESILFTGHTHHQEVYTVGNQLVINPGAVGVPQGSQGQAQFLILESVDADTWHYEMMQVPYDREGEIRDLRESGLYDLAPYWCQITEHLLRFGTIPHGTVLKEVMQADGFVHPWYDVPDEYWEKVIHRLFHS